MLILEEKLPHKKCFYSSVKAGATNDDGEKLDGHMSDKDYLTCNKIWNELNMKNMGDYHNHYQKKKMFCYQLKFLKILLTRVFIDPWDYFGSPGLNWYGILKMTGLKLEKKSDISMYLSIEKELRGGISYIAKRYSEANNKYMKNYDPTKPSIYISYLDMNTCI